MERKTGGPLRGTDRLMKARRLFMIALLNLSALQAHHSFAAEFDSAKVVTLRGKVARVVWMNPHVFFYVDVADPSGKVTTWKIESASPNGVQRQGWAKNALKAGDPVTVEAWLAKDEDNFAKSISLMLPDGRKVFTGFGDERGSVAGGR
jgi:Family of unknown function (DUF6152)